MTSIKFVITIRNSHDIPPCPFHIAPTFQADFLVQKQLFPGKDRAAASPDQQDSYNVQVVLKKGAALL